MNRPRSSFIRRVFTFLLIFSVSLMSGAFFGLQQPANASLVERLHELRSTSPDSGIYPVASSTFNVAATDEVIENLQSMSDHAAMGMQASDPELKAMSEDWHNKAEDALTGAQAKRSRLLRESLDALKSTSPESGI